MYFNLHLANMHVALILAVLSFKLHLKKKNYMLLKIFKESQSAHNKYMHLIL